MVGRVGVGVAAAAVIALAACSAGGPAPPGDRARATSGAPSPVPSTTAAASSAAPGTQSRPDTQGTQGTPSPPGPSAPSDPSARLTLAFAGDIHFDGTAARLLARPSTALASLRPLLGAADLAMVNLETAITGRGRPAPKTYHFRAPPRALRAVASSGADVVTMANNHAVDYGRDGFEDTLAARRSSPLPVVGIGANAADAYAPAVLRARGLQVAFLGATQVPDWTLATWPARRDRPGVASAADRRRLAEAVQAARAVADVVVVYLHWGTDYTSCPDAAQERTARSLATAGADVIVGAHAHRVQAAGWRGRTYVAYGLGNFVWHKNSPEPDATSGVLTLTLQGRRVVAHRWTPLVVSADGVPRPPSAARSRVLERRWSSARSCSDLSARPRRP